MEDLPNKETLHHVATLKNPGTTLDHLTSPRTSLTDNNDMGSVLFGTSYPLVPCKLVKKIRDGEFVEMVDLLPDQLASSGDSELAKNGKNCNQHYRVGEMFRFIHLNYRLQCPRKSGRSIGISNLDNRCLHRISRGLLGRLRQAVQVEGSGDLLPTGQQWTQHCGTGLLVCCQVPQGVHTASASPTNLESVNSLQISG